ncbi:hypothetical protein [Mangrovitalea sediminis]|uniref:hypothetical protein n=1 Tax=Mangrovitalea sediminis TaxID=1982043 RepID=UPI001304238C|nr:hypothetical protein [Mangrovitalea sediminis]
MKALFKTLFGDWINLGFVILLVALEFALVRAGYPSQAGLAVPLVILGGVSVLARR